MAFERVFGGAVSGYADELRRTFKAAERIAAEIAVVPHAGERVRVEHLHEQRGRAADHHGREIAVDAPADEVAREQAVVAARRRALAIAADELAGLSGDRAAQWLHGRRVGRGEAVDEVGGSALCPRHDAALDRHDHAALGGDAVERGVAREAGRGVGVDAPRGGFVEEDEIGVLARCDAAAGQAEGARGGGGEAREELERG